LLKRLYAMPVYDILPPSLILCNHCVKQSSYYILCKPHYCGSKSCLFQKKYDTIFYWRISVCKFSPIRV